MNERQANSRLPGFHRLSVGERAAQVSEILTGEPAEVLSALRSGGLSPDMAARLSENVIGIHALPFSIAPNFIINGRETLVPMVIEEPSVVAAAGNAARLARAGGGFQVDCQDPQMICQIQLFCDRPSEAGELIALHEQDLIDRAADVDPMLRQLGGGPREIVVRRVAGTGGDGDEDAFLVLHLVVDVRDAMGANAVNTMGEALAPQLEELTGGRVGLRILTNLADRRLVTARVEIPAGHLALGGYSSQEVQEGIVSASRFAEADPYRAATHNKGIMNGVDAVVLATGNDWRAVEAGAHAFAAQGGTYRPLATWQSGPAGELRGELVMPMAVGIVGGATRLHPTARLALRIMGADRAQTLAEVAAACGLANNLAALRALASEGIQKGHMRLHLRSRDLEQEARR